MPARWHSRVRWGAATLPPWPRFPIGLIPSPTPASSARSMSGRSSERGISGARLDGAGRRGAGPPRGGARVPDGIVAVCGKGNNGGDGFVAARLLRERGRDVDVLLLGEVEELRGDARVNAERLPGPPPEPFTASALDDAVAIIDAILGTASPESRASRRPARSPRSTMPRRLSSRAMFRAAWTHRRARSRAWPCGRVPPPRSTRPSRGYGSTPERRTRARSAWSTSASRTAHPARRRSG